MMNIRGHHLLCLLNFRGKGYSPKFITNTKKVIKKLSTVPIIITTESDMVCAACPYNKNNRCVKKENSEEKVKKMDRKIIKRFGFRVGEQTEIDRVWEKIKENITAKDFVAICRDCQWASYCAKLLKFNKL